MIINLFIKGLFTGLLASIPLGPIGVICIQRTINKNRISGFISGMGAASADTLFATIAGFSLTFIISFVKEKEFIFQAISGLVVFLLGIKIFLTNPVKQVKRHKKKPNNLLGDYFTVLAVTITNPLAIFIFVALFASLGVVTDNFNINQTLLTISGVFIGASLWWYILTTIVDTYRHKFRLRHLWWINKISGATIFTLGGLVLIGLIRFLL